MVYDCLHGVLVGQLKVVCSNFLVIFITKHFGSKVLLQIGYLDDLHFSAWVTFAADESFGSDLYFLIELGVAYASYNSAFIRHFTVFLVEVFEQFPDNYCFVLGRAHKNCVTLELDAADLHLVLTKLTYHAVVKLGASRHRVV